MKQIYLVYSESKDGKQFAHAESARVRTNIMDYGSIYYHTDIIRVCESATEAYSTAQRWNEAYKKNGTYMDWEGYNEYATEPSKDAWYEPVGKGIW